MDFASTHLELEISQSIIMAFVMSHQNQHIPFVPTPVRSNNAVLMDITVAKENVVPTATLSTPAKFPIKSVIPTKTLVPPKATNSDFASTLLVKGRPLPPLKQHTIAALNSFELKKFSHCRTLYTEEDIPMALADVKSPNWSNNPYLMDVFKRHKTITDKNGITRRIKKKLSIGFPKCLLFAAHDMTDRIILINWWLQQSIEEQREVKKAFRYFFLRPSKSATPLKYGPELYQEHLNRGSIHGLKL